MIKILKYETYNNLIEQITGFKKETLKLKTDKSSLEEEVKKYKTTINNLEKRLKVSKVDVEIFKETARNNSNTIKEEKKKQEELKKRHRKKLSDIIKTYKNKQDISKVLQTANETADNHYKQQLQKTLNQFYNWTNDVKGNKLEFFSRYEGTPISIEKLDVKIESFGYVVHKEDEEYPEKAKVKEFNKSASEYFARAEITTGKKFKESNMMDIFIERFSKVEHINPEKEIQDEDVMLQFSFQDPEEGTYHLAWRFGVEADPENIYGKWMKKDLPKVIVAAATGAFENASRNEKYSLAKRIAEKYLTEENSEVYAPIIKKAISNNPKAAGYFSNLELKDNK